MAAIDQAAFEDWLRARGASSSLDPVSWYWASPGVGYRVDVGGTLYDVADLLGEYAGLGYVLPPDPTFVGGVWFRPSIPEGAPVLGIPGGETGALGPADVFSPYLTPTAEQVRRAQEAESAGAGATAGGPGVLANMPLVVWGALAALAAWILFRRRS